MYKHNKKSEFKGFTLVELIVVITILAILGTIAFISLQGYSASARDSRKLSDIQNIKKSLELFILNSGKYPLPDNGAQVNYGGDLVWTQGTVGDNVAKNLSKNLQKKPTDPLTEQEYTYSTTNTQKNYELLSVYESDLFSYNSILKKINAEGIYYVKVDGTYNGVYVQTPNYYVPTPSIINAEVNSLDITLNETNIKSQVVSGGNNLLTYGTKTQTIGALDVNLSVYTGSITKNSSSAEKIALAQKLQQAYSGSSLASKPTYKNIVETSEDNLVILVDNLVIKSITASNNSGGGGGGGGGAFICPAEFAGEGQAITTSRTAQSRISPDGNWIIYRNSSFGSILYKKPFSDNTTDDGIAITTANVRYPNYSPDGTKIIYLNQSVEPGTLYIKNANTTDDGTEFISNPGTESYDTPVFTPDGTKVIYDYNGPEGSYLMIKSASDNTGTGEILINHYGEHVAFTPAGDIVYRNGNDGLIYKIDAIDVNFSSLPISSGYPIIQTEGNRLTLSFDGTKVLYNKYLDGYRQLLEKSTSDTNDGINILPGIDVRGTRHSYSPDGNWIIYTNGSNGDKLYKKCANQ